jgi:hypothetical protein
VSEICETDILGDIMVCRVALSTRAFLTLPLDQFNPSMNSGLREEHSLRSWPLAAQCCIQESSYLVDPASSHMLVSKIKPCMSKYKQICTVKLRMAH